MPNGPTHRVAGGVAGGGLALARATGQPPEAVLIEVFGGVVGGVVGGRLPDIFDPATTPRHRSTAHSALAGLVVVGAALEDARSYCRERADTYRRLKAQSGLNDGARLWYALLELVWQFLAGALTGLQAGYVSHLALDALTPAGLPLLG